MRHSIYEANSMRALTWINNVAVDLDDSAPVKLPEKCQRSRVLAHSGEGSTDPPQARRRRRNRYPLSFHAKQISHASCTLIQTLCHRVGPRCYLCVPPNSWKRVDWCSHFYFFFFCPSFGLRRISDFDKRAFWVPHRTHNSIDYYFRASE